jgi:protein arginine kinase
MLLNEPYEPKAAEARTKGQHPEPQIIMSSRVRLARNLRGERFPDWASERERVEVLRRVGTAAVQAAEHPDAKVIPMEGIDGVRMETMRERSLISRDLVDRGVGAGVVYAGIHSLSIMINEEDHIRIQAFEFGLGLSRAWEIADAFDTRLEKLVPYAFSERLGYLTACPSNIGTGMRASVMVHLPGLRLSGDLDAVIRGLERLRFTVRGIGGEGSAASGHRFQISNQGTLGLDERAVIASLERVTVEVARQEGLARKRVLRDMPVVVKDCVSRALAILQNAHLIQADEALDYLSAVRMGIEMGVIQDARPDVLEMLELMVHPGHLQGYLKEEMDPEQRDLRRADLLRERLDLWTVNEWLVRKARKRLIVKEKK